MTTVEHTATVETLKFEEPMRRFRFLMSDGRVVDVEATSDGSVLRDWVRAQLGGKKSGADGLRIEGVAELPDQAPLL